MTDKIQTQHPDPEKLGVNIDKVKYDTMRLAILEILQSQGEITFQDLMDAVHQKLTGSFAGSIGWYYTTVKLDLEARHEIERVPGSKPQRIRLILK